MCARLVQHFGLTWSDVRSLPLRDFNALADQLTADLKQQDRGNRRIPKMT